MTYTGTLTPSQFVSATYTVPTGKIWKIKYVNKLPYVTVSNINGVHPLYNGFALNINSKWLFGDNFTEILNDYSANKKGFILWKSAIEEFN